jgi:hypothetical protein
VIRSNHLPRVWLCLPQPDPRFRPRTRRPPNAGQPLAGLTVKDSLPAAQRSLFATLCSASPLEAFGQNHPPQGDTGPCFGDGYGRRRDLPPRAPGFVKITEPKIMNVVAPRARFGDRRAAPNSRRVGRGKYQRRPRHALPCVRHRLEEGTADDRPESRSDTWWWVAIAVNLGERSLAPPPGKPRPSSRCATSLNVALESVCCPEREIMSCLIWILEQMSLPSPGTERK